MAAETIVIKRIKKIKERSKKSDSRFEFKRTTLTRNQSIETSLRIEEVRPKKSTRTFLN